MVFPDGAPEEGRWAGGPAQSIKGRFKVHLRWRSPQLVWHTLSVEHLAEQAATSIFMKLDALWRNDSARRVLLLVGN